MVTLDDLLDTGHAKHRAGQAGRQAGAALAAGLYWAGWVLFKLVRFALLAVGGVFWAFGWTARRAAWPALTWCAAAVRLGWEDGRAGGARVPR